MDATTSSPVHVLNGSSSRSAAMQMDLGNLIGMLLLPLPLLWFGGSILICDPAPPSSRSEPFSRAGGILPWLLAWAAGLAVIVPWSLWSIARIRREDWPDIELPKN